MVDDRALSFPDFARLDERFAFTVDVAAAAHNAKCARFYTREIDGLRKSWAGERVYCNPPYSEIRPWVEKAWRECGLAELIVLLLPANRTEQGWWQELVEPARDKPDSMLRTEFMCGRVHFQRPDRTRPSARGSCPPFGCCLLIWTHGTAA